MIWRAAAASLLAKAAVGALAVAACSAQPAALTRLRETSGAYTTNSGFAEPTRLVVRDSGEWQRVWPLLGAGRSLPAVDFARSVVLVAALGPRRSGGFDIRIESIESSGAAAVVTVIERSPPPGCSVSAALTSPADIVIAPRNDGGFTFRSVATQVRC